MPKSDTYMYFGHPSLARIVQKKSGVLSFTSSLSLPTLMTVAGRSSTLSFLHPSSNRYSEASSAARGTTLGLRTSFTPRTMSYENWVSEIKSLLNLVPICKKKRSADFFRHVHYLHQARTLLVWDSFHTCLVMFVICFIEYMNISCCFCFFTFFPFLY